MNDEKQYAIHITRADLDLITTALCELPAKHVLYLLGRLKDQFEAQSADGEQDAVKSP
jgi:hypothetical protein